MQVENLSVQEWENFVDNTKSATFFHTYRWYRIWEEYAGYRSRAYLIHFKSGHKIMLPLASKRILKGLMARYQSSPAGTYGGFVTDDVLTAEELLALEKWLKRFNTISITFNPFSNHHVVFSTMSRDFTQTISLTASWEEIVSQMKKGHILRKVRMANRNQLEVGEITPQEVSLFHDIYLSRREAWKTPTNHYDLLLFELLFGLPNVDFWGIYLPDKTLIGGGIFLSHKGHVSSWLPIVLTEYLPLKPYELLFFECMKFYKKEKLSWFDFNPSGGHEGVVRFKAGFGARKKEVVNFDRRSLIVDLLLNASTRLRKGLIGKGTAE